MNIGQIKSKTIEIIREKSNGGSLIGSGDNADYLFSMPGFINDAQFYIANKVPVFKKLTLTTPDEVTTKNNKYDMPDDFQGLKYIKLNDELFDDYDFEDDTLVIPICYEGTFKIGYYAFPAVIDDSINDNEELEVKLDLQMIIPYYVAGHVIIDENPQLAEFFLNEFESKLRRIKIKNVQRRIKLKYGGEY